MVFLFPAFILLILGYLIKVKKMTSLISGYNISSSTQQAKYNIDELTKQVGNFVYGLSFIMIGLSFSLIIFPSNETIIMMISPIILVIYIILGLLFLNLNKRQ